MADLVLTATSVVASGSSNSITAKIAGGTITAGQPVAINTSTGKVEPADVDSGTAYLNTVYGIALNGAAANQPVRVMRKGSLTVNAVLTKGTIYVGSDTAGGIKPVADLASGDVVNYIGTASSTTVLDVQILNTGITV